MDASSLVSLSTIDDSKNLARWRDEWKQVVSLEVALDTYIALKPLYVVAATAPTATTYEDALRVSGCDPC